ncbi:sigma 54 modulation/S30EA ribosomal C-terminal domain-containing protein [Bacillus salitolerans]|uniref:Sigma 54 modulation/S30EA ribosomal C-terminal domain-containing protein n=1 Tax=Bacillus salitolerans TaxID=1437434 RepID=A0ABW4LRH4_9BACI
MNTIPPPFELQEIEYECEEVVWIMRFDIKPINKEEAILQMNMLDHNIV